MSVVVTVVVRGRCNAHASVQRTCPDGLVWPKVHCQTLGCGSGQGSSLVGGRHKPVPTATEPAAVSLFAPQSIKKEITPRPSPPSTCAPLLSRGTASFLLVHPLQQHESTRAAGEFAGNSKATAAANNGTAEPTLCHPAPARRSSAATLSMMPQREPSWTCLRSMGQCTGLT